MEQDKFTKSLDRETVIRALVMITNAYEDYLGARVLINNGLIKQGVTFASSSIEKYLKAFLIMLEVKYKYFHLDDLSKAEKWFAGTPFEKVFSSIDHTFLVH